MGIRRFKHFLYLDVSVILGYCKSILLSYKSLIKADVLEYTVHRI